MAGLVSDYTGGRGTTCVVMLLLGAPMVCTCLIFAEVFLFVCFCGCFGQENYLQHDPHLKQTISKVPESTTLEQCAANHMGN